MKHLLRILIFGITLIQLASALQAQHPHPNIYHQEGKSLYDKTCGVTESLEAFKNQYPDRYADNLANYYQLTSQLNKRLNKKSIAASCPDGIIVIPIAFHLFHSPDDAIGTGENYSLADLQKVVDQLNADFAAANFNKSHITREFQKVDPGHSCIQFAIGKINRIDRTTCDSWVVNGRFSVLSPCLPGGAGPGSSNDPHDYLNVYVNVFNTNLLGQASCIPGIFGSCNDDNDGVIINSKIFVPYQDNPRFPTANEGSVLTHEVGHWLGLPHVNGDIAGAGCTGDDGFQDTNPQANQTRYNCDNNIPVSCGTSDNVFNYLDYASDCATAMFTAEQKARMLHILNTERSGLLTSYENGNADNSLFNVACTANTITDLRDTIRIDCYGSVNLLHYLSSWYPSSINDRHHITGLQTYSWSAKGLNGSYINSYFDIGNAYFLHESNAATDTILLSLTQRCWQPSSQSYTSGQLAGELYIITSNCSATNNETCSTAKPVNITPVCSPQIFPYYDVANEGLFREPACALSGSDKDLWFYTEIPNSGNLSIEITDADTKSLTDMVMEVYIGSCGNLQLLTCVDDFGGSLQPKALLDNLPQGQRLYLRIIESRSDEEGLFGICITEFVTNDDCEIATTLPVNSSCTFEEYPIINAKTSALGLYSPCANIGAANDVWFHFVAPASGVASITTADGLDKTSTDLILEAYRGTCQDLEILACNDDYNGNFNFIVLSDLTPGEDIYLRINTLGSFFEGNFRICVTDANEHLCSFNFIELGTAGDCNPLSNTFDLPLTIHYNDLSGASSLDINGQQFSLTSNPQHVVLKDLPANGNLLDINATISDCTFGNYFNLYDRVRAPDNCYSLSVTNDECLGATPINIGDSCTYQTFSNLGATKSNVPANTCAIVPFNPQDVWFTFDMPISESVIINTWQTKAVEPLLQVYTGTCGNLAFEKCSNREESLRLDNIPAGTTIYVNVHDWEEDHQGEFGLCVFEPTIFSNDICDTATPLSISAARDGLIYSNHPAMAEEIPTATMSCESSTTPSQDMWFSIIAPPTGVVDIIAEIVQHYPIDFTMELYEGSCANLTSIECAIPADIGSTELSTLNANNLTPGATYYLRVANTNQDAPTAFKLSAVVLPANHCSTAQIMTADGDCVTIQTEGFSASSWPNQSSLCGPLNDGVDAWLQVEVPASGNLQVTSQVSSGSVYQVTLEAYRGSCDALNIIACSHYGDRYTTYDDMATLELLGLMPGETIWIRAFSGYERGALSFCTSSIASQYPCKVELIQAGNQYTCDPSSNSFDQELIVSYRHDGTATKLNVSGQIFDLTGSPQTVTLQNLPATGEYRHYITANLRNNSNTYNACRINSQYEAFNLFNAPNPCVMSAPINDNCVDAIPLSYTQDCRSLDIATYSNLGGSYEPFTPRSFPCAFSRENPQDVWFTSVVPDNGEFILRFDTPTGSSIDPVVEFYEGPCYDLKHLPVTCIQTPQGRSRRYSNLPSGRKIYLRVADRNNDDQGEFKICLLAPESFTNDNCDHALLLKTTSSCDTLVYSNHLNTASLEPSSILNCELSFVSESKDMWFKAIMPEADSLYLRFDAIEASYSIAPFLIELYQGSCDNLVYMDCHQMGLDNSAPLFVTQEEMIEDTLWMRVSNYAFGPAATFQLCTQAKCPNYEYIKQDNYARNHIQTYFNIVSESHIGDSLHIIYDAGTEIELLPGFEVEHSALFEAQIGGCGRQ